VTRQHYIEARIAWNSEQIVQTLIRIARTKRAIAKIEAMMR